MDTTRVKLLPCPCGKTPTDLELSNSNGYKYAIAAPNCCGEWMIEFRTEYFLIDSEECKQLAIESWNNTTRNNNESSRN